MLQLAPRKHRRQMTADEIRVAETAIKGVGVWQVSRHAILRMQERHGHHLVCEIIAEGEVIEVRPDSRAVMRAPNGDCLALSYKDKYVLAYWWNAPSDQHDTLNLEAYRWKGSVAEAFA